MTLSAEIGLSTGFGVPGGAGSGAGAPPKLEHAFLELHDPPLKPGTLKPGPLRGRIDFQFNPTQFSTTKAAEWRRSTQRGSAGSGYPEFLGALPRQVTLEMFLDSSSPPTDTVFGRVNELFECCVPTQESLERSRSSPPWVIFHWGPQTGFPSYISRVAVTYTLFTPAGLPIRATATVTLEELTLAKTGTNPTSGGLPARALHTVVSGDTLPAIAWREYGDASRWRGLAAANGIDDPMRLRAGATLLVPSEADLADAR